MYATYPDEIAFPVLQTVSTRLKHFIRTHIINVSIVAKKNWKMYINYFHLNFETVSKPVDAGTAPTQCSLFLYEQEGLQKLWSGTEPVKNMC